MATAVSNVLEMLKYTYGVDRVLYLANQESVVFNILARVKKPVGGRGQFIMPITTQNPGTFKGITEGGTLPTALNPDTTEALFSLQEYAGIYDVTWKLIQDARTSKFAFQQAVAYLDEGFKRRFMRLLNADLIDNGKGRLGILPAADNQTTITVNALPLVEKGMVIDIMDLSDDDTKLVDSRTVNAVNVATREITISGAALAGSAAGDYFVIEDTTDVSISGALHTHGLLDIISDVDPDAVVGDYGGIDRTAAGTEFWESLVLSNGGVNRPLTEDLMLQAMDGARERGGGMVNAWISNLAIARRYHEMLRAESFYAISTQPGQLGGGLGRKSMSDGGPEGVGKTPYQFSGVDWHVEPYFAANTIVGLDTEHFFLGVGENEVPRPISEIFDGVTRFKETTSATFEVVWYYQVELLSDHPASGVKITDVAET